MNLFLVHAVAVPGTQHDQFVCMNEIEIEAGSFVEHIRVKALRPEQADARNKFLPFVYQHFQLGFQLGNLALDHRAPDQSEFTIHRMETEIAKGRNRNDRRDETAEEGLFTLTGSCSGHSLGP